MKALKWFAPHDMRLVDTDMPVPAAHEALVRVESVGICGSDLHYFTDGGIGNTKITTPLALGHEFAGTVEAVGANADQGLVGKRVAVEPGIPCGVCECCDTGHYNVCEAMFFPGMPPNEGCLSEYFAVHAKYCFPVPEGMSAPVAAMIEPAAVAVHTVELAKLKPGETAAILGLGPIGLLTAQVAKLAGVSVLYGTDLHDYRVEAGRRYGCDEAFNATKCDVVEAIMQATNGRGVDVAFDCARSSETPDVACRVVRPAGRCVLTGISGAEIDPFPVCVARRKGLTLHWCRRFRYSYPRTIRLVHSGQIDVESMITHSFGLENAAKGFELLVDFEEDVLKVSVDQ